MVTYQLQKSSGLVEMFIFSLWVELHTISGDHRKAQGSLWASTTL